MNNLKLKILERAYVEPGLTIGGLADDISRGIRTERDVRYLMEKGYLLNERGLEISSKNLACLDSDCISNRTKRVGKGALGIAASVIAVLIGNGLWDLIQTFL